MNTFASAVTEWLIAVSLYKVAQEARVDVDINAKNDSSVAQINLTSAFDSNPNKLFSYTSRGTIASPLASADTDQALVFEAYAHDGSGFISTSAIRFDVSGTPSTNVMYGDILFFTNRGSTSSSEAMRIDSSGNVGIGTSSFGASSVGNLHLGNGTAPTGSITNGVILYSEDVSSSAELKVRDEAGNVTTLSPHNFELIPEGPSEELAWSYYSERDGKAINIDMLKAIRLLENLSGEKLVFENE